MQHHFDGLLSHFLTSTIVQQVLDEIPEGLPEE
jgi:hypothetical protein